MYKRQALERLFSALVNYRESHQRPLVIVHGGGCVVDELMKGLNLPVKKKDGLRVTPADQKMCIRDRKYWLKYSLASLVLVSNITNRTLCENS